MNQNAKLWVEALKSGEYKQTKDQLRATEEDGTHSYCCLGVACKLHGEQTGEGGWITGNYRGAPGVDSYRLPDLNQQEATTLPSGVTDWLGLRWPTGGHTDTDGSYKTLAGMNDDGSTFEEIAQIIESEPTDLFAG